MSEDEYISEEVKLLESPFGQNGIEGYMDELGNIVRYNRKKNWFAVGNDKGLFTFYAPRDGQSYFDFLMRRSLSNGGKKK